MSSNQWSTDIVGLDIAAVSDYFARHVPGVRGPLAARLLHGGRSNLTYEATDGATSWVIRRPPLGLVAPTANDVAREFRFVAALGPTPVPVPEAVALCEDASVTGAPFSVVSRVHGEVIRTVADAEAIADPAACAGELVRTLSTIHQVDSEAVGLRSSGDPFRYLERQVARWKAQWDVVATRSTADVVRMHERLAARVPTTIRPGIVHGDYRIDNVILAAGDPTRIAAVIDWEMATVGDPLADLGMLLVYWDPVCGAVLADGHPTSANPGFPPPAELVEVYTSATGAPIDHLAFYVALAYFKLAVIAEGIHRRYVDGDTVGRGFGSVGTTVEPLLAAGLRTITQGLWA